MPIVETVRAPVDVTQLGTTLRHEHDAGADQLFASLAGAEACRQIRFVHARWLCARRPSIRSRALGWWSSGRQSARTQAHALVGYHDVCRALDVGRVSAAMHLGRRGLVNFYWTPGSPGA